MVFLVYLYYNAVLVGEIIEDWDLIEGNNYLIKFFDKLTNFYVGNGRKIYWWELDPWMLIRLLLLFCSRDGFCGTLPILLLYYFHFSSTSSNLPTL